MIGLAMIPANNPAVVQVDLQQACSPTPTFVPEIPEFSRWVGLAIHHAHGSSGKTEVSIRLVDEDESRALNRQYRGKDQPTNILSFPTDFPKGVDVPLLGDLIICVPLVQKEANRQQKSLQAHWVHLIIHGTLHLLGYDHREARETAIMEALEVQLLRQLGYSNPYFLPGQ